MAYENLCMYCFGEMDGNEICPHCGKDSRAAVPQIQLLPGTLVYNDRFLIGRALGQDANGIVYIAMDTKRGGTIRIREYLPRNCAERTNDGSVVPIAGMEDAYEAGMKKLRASVENVEDPRKRHFYFEENGTAYIAQRKSAAPQSAVDDDEMDDEADPDRGKSRTVLYIAIGAAVAVAAVIALLVLLNSLGSGDTTKEALPSVSPSASVMASWAPKTTASPTPYATATFAALKDPELSWMDYTYSGNVDQDYADQTGTSQSGSTSRPTAKPTGKPTILDTAESKNYTTISGSSSKSDITRLQQYLANLGWLEQRYVNGSYNSATRQAVKDFQNYVNNYCSPAEKLVVDGIAGKKTQQWLLNSSISLRKPTPSVTASPSDVAVDANSSRSDVRAVQRKLIALGIMNSGDDDGVYGVSTKNAVKNFQSRVNQLQGYDALEVSGVVDVNTMAFLNYYVDWWESRQTAQPTVTPTPAPTATPSPTPDNGTINAWSSAKDIGGLQNMLAKLGLLDTRDVDGVYGNKTVSAVKTFQYWVNDQKGTQTLVPSGDCDALTMAYLEYCIQNNIRVIEPTASPTAEPTKVPEEEEGKNIVVDASSAPETISFVQEMLRDVGLLSDSDIDGDYGRRTLSAVGRFQQYVNEQMGTHTLDVTGLCDSLTLQYLEFYQGNGWKVPGTATAEPTQQPTSVPTEAPTVEPTQQPTAEPAAEPTQVPTQDGAITPESPAQAIMELQDKLNRVGLLASSDVNGDYGETTAQAIRTFQEFVNSLQGAGTLEVTGVCDPETMQYLDYCVDNNKDVGAAIATPEPTEEPAAAPTDEPTIEPTAEPDPTIDSESTPEQIMMMQEKLRQVNLLDVTDVDGHYGEKTEQAIRAFQEFVNSIQGAGTLEVTGVCDPETMQYLDYCVDNNRDVGAAIATPEPTEEPTPEPTAEPIGSINALYVNIAGYDGDGVITLDEGDHSVQWNAEGDVQGYYLKLLDAHGNSLREAGPTEYTEFNLSTADFTPGEVYTLQIGAMPVNGSDADILWQSVQFVIPLITPEPTEEPTPEPTREPTVSVPTITIDSSAYQQDGIPYITSDPIFNWMAEGDVEAYDVSLVHQDGTTYPLGTVTGTSKSVPLSQLPAGLYKLYVTAIAVGGGNTATGEMLFGVPAAEPDPTEAPTEEPAPDQTQQPTQPVIEYLDANSSADDIRYVQLKLYQAGLLRVDDMQEGVLDYATLSAIAEFQMRANEMYDLNLTVIDPEIDVYVDADTLNALFNIVFE